MEHPSLQILAHQQITHWGHLQVDLVNFNFVGSVMYCKSKPLGGIFISTLHFMNSSLVSSLSFKKSALDIVHSLVISAILILKCKESKG